MLNRDDGKLQHHSQETVAAQLFRDAAHDELVGDGADEESRDHGYGLGSVAASGVVDVTAEEMVHRDVPFAREFKPVFVVSIHTGWQRMYAPIA